MRYQTSSSDHVGSHAIANEEKDILGLSNGCKIADEPVGDRGLSSIVIGEGGSIVTRLVKRDSSVDFGRDLNQGGCEGFLCEKVWKFG